MHVTLLFPPGTDARNPHLAIPSLTASLRAAGVRTTVRDLNLEGLLTLIEPSNVAEAIRVCRMQLQRTTDRARRQRLARALVDADFVQASIGDAPNLLRSPETFYQPYFYHTAREGIARALELISAATGRVFYNIGPVRYDVEGISATRLSDLAAVTADPAANLFDRVYRESLLPDLDRDRPDVVGISILNFQQVIPGLALARLLREHGHFVVLGGTVYSKFAEALPHVPEFFDLFCDGLVVYEGETALITLLDELAGTRRLQSVPNFLHRNENGEVVMGPTYVENVNALPTPDFSDLPLDRYLAPTPVFPLLTGKGCYFNRCKFCDIPFINHVSRKPYRLRAPERIAGDVAELQRRFGARYFEITDEALAPKLLLHLADALDDHPDVEARFTGFARLERGFTPEVCRRIYEMGMRKLFFGLESGSQEMLDHMNKGINVGTASTVLRNCTDAGISFHLFSIIGFPEETEEHARDTLQFFLDNRAVMNLPQNSFDVHRFTLDLRTEYGDNPEAFGIVIDEQDLVDHDFPLSIGRWTNTHGLSSEAVERLLNEFHAELRRAFRTYHVYPMHLWPDFATYAVLYADHYSERPFSFRFTLPPSGDPTPFQLVWSESVRLKPAQHGYFVHSMMGETIVTKAVLAVLARPLPPMPVDALLHQLAATLDLRQSSGRIVAELRPIIDALLSCGALRLEPRVRAESRIA